MHKNLIVGLLVLLLLAACSTDTEERLSALEAQIETLTTRNVDLENQPGALQVGAEEHAADAAKVAVAQFIMDGADFHELEETLIESGEIDPAYPGLVTRVNKVLANTQWPEPLADEAGSFVTLLSEFAEALEADDVVNAMRLSSEVHEAQHDFSHNVDNWLGSGDHHD